MRSSADDIFFVFSFVVPNIVEYFAGRDIGSVQYVTGDFGEQSYILFTSGRGAVGMVHRSRAGWCRVVTGIRSGVYLCGFRYVG